jgi:hypothetical protein
MVVSTPIPFSLGIVIDKYLRIMTVTHSFASIDRMKNKIPSNDSLKQSLTL